MVQQPLIMLACKRKTEEGERETEERERERESEDEGRPGQREMRRGRKTRTHAKPDLAVLPASKEKEGKSTRAGPQKRKRRRRKGGRERKSEEAPEPRKLLQRKNPLRSLPKT